MTSGYTLVSPYPNTTTGGNGMGETGGGKHRPKVGSWTPAPKGESGFGIVGAITKKLLGRLTGWDNPGRGDS